MSAEAQLSALQISLPPAPPKGGVYKPLVIVGNVAYLSGHGPYLADGGMIRGRVGEDLDLAEGHAAAKQTALAMLATLQKELGSLDRIKRVVKLLGMVNATPEFSDHPKVILMIRKIPRDSLEDIRQRHNTNKTFPIISNDCHLKS